MGIGGQTSQLKVFFFLPDAETNCLLQLWLIWIILCVILISLTLKQTESRRASCTSPADPRSCIHFSETKTILWLDAYRDLPPQGPSASARLLAVTFASGPSYRYIRIWRICLPPSCTKSRNLAVLFVYFLYFSVWFQVDKRKCPQPCFLLFIMFEMTVIKPQSLFFYSIQLVFIKHSTFC